ncbi:hypothetical protein BV22DRAFT_463084 [Leucogyrophana mollusca]|uniref:Uncharacterized protein n=1 Tax=Leucogyrophana mollusca TaxID=85980 RepID=A0ACB8BJN2_9AGAM|nr:hypothetical protein BV22DRAFT_463084 [Leucogyrophana mollusca]
MPSGRRVTLDADIWLKILCLCSAADIVDTCTALAAICENPKIWYYALLQVSYAKRLPNLRYRIPSMPARIIKEKALTSVSLDEMWGQRSVKPTKTYQLSVPHAHTVAMLPGGDWILLLGTRSSVGELQLFETDIGKPARRFTFTEIRSQGQQTTVLSVYQLITTAPSIQLKFTMSIQPKLDGYTAMDDYVAYGWVEPSGKHFIKLMRLDTDYRTTVGQCTMEVELRPGKYMHVSDGKC